MTQILESLLVIGIFQNSIITLTRFNHACSNYVTAVNSLTEIRVTHQLLYVSVGGMTLASSSAILYARNALGAALNFFD